MFLCSCEVTWTFHCQNSNHYLVNIIPRWGLWGCGTEWWMGPSDGVTQRTWPDFSVLRCRHTARLVLPREAEKSKCNCFLSSSRRELMGHRRRPTRTARRRRDDPSFPGPALTAVDVAFSNQGPIKKLISMRERGGGRARADCIQLHAHYDSSGALSGWWLLEAAKTLRQPEDDFLLELQMGLRLRAVTSRTETSSFGGFCTQHLLFAFRMNSAAMMTNWKAAGFYSQIYSEMWKAHWFLISLALKERDSGYLPFVMSQGGGGQSPLPGYSERLQLVFCSPFQTCGLSN